MKKMSNHGAVCICAAELKIRWIFEDNSEIIFLVSQ